MPDDYSTPAAASDAEESDLYADTPHSPMEIVSSKPDTPAKRKRDEHSPVVPNDKKRKVEIARDLPLEIWQHIFTFMAPRDLATVMRVNRDFNACLTTTRATPNGHPQGRLSVIQNSDSIWVQSRQTYFPDMPDPLTDLTELGMWRLLASKKCSVCNSLRASANVEPRIIWPFAVSLCVSCLLSETQTDKEMFFEGHDWLRDLIPFTYVKNKSELVSLTQASTPDFQTEGVLRLFYKSSIPGILERLKHARTQDSMAKDDLMRRLKVDRSDRLQSALTWENWAQKGGHTQHFRRAKGSLEPHISPPHTLSLPCRPAISVPVLPQPLPGTWRPSRPNSIVHLTTQPPPTASTPSFKSRNLQDAIEAKAVRRSEIERRCRGMSPPIAPELLIHMDAFNAALQITTELTDTAWAVLKPRLVAQKQAAEAKYAEIQRIALESYRREGSSGTMQDWEESQGPLRRRLAHYAQHTITSHWANGVNVDSQNAADFASHVLRSVRDQYEADFATHGVALGDEEPLVRKDCPVPDGPLVLDAMKWVYNTSVKPFAERHGREVFLCNECKIPILRNYSFEGVIQHYASVHTTDFSDGSSGVAWRKAAWPLQPPFAPDPTNRKAASLYPRGGANATSPNYFGQNRGRTFRPPVDMVVNQTFNPPFPLHTNPASPTQPFAPRPQYPVRMGPAFSYSEPHSQIPFSGFYPTPGNPHGSPTVTPYGSAYPYSRPATSTPASTIAYPTPGPQFGPYLPPPPPPLPQLSGAPHLDGQFPAANAIAYAAPPRFGSAMPPPPVQISHSRILQSQRDEIVRNALDIFNALSRIFRIPSSVIIYTVIRHVVFLSNEHYMHEPSLDLFTDCVMNHPLMILIKNAPNLACKTCVLDGTAESQLQYGQRQLYPFSSLLGHFKAYHVERVFLTGQRTPDMAEPMTRVPDWKEDMIELPSDAIIADIAEREGNTIYTRTILAKLFPRLIDFDRGTASVRDTEYDPRRPDVVGPRPLSQDTHRSREWEPSQRPQLRDKGQGRVVFAHGDDGKEYEILGPLSTVFVGEDVPSGVNPNEYGSHDYRGRHYNDRMSSSRSQHRQQAGRQPSPHIKHEDEEEDEAYAYRGHRH